ncbi:MAG: cupredoxin domain-containing protein [Nitrosotalea sp.]
MINIVGSSVFVANGLPLFHIEVRSENGTKVFDSGYSGMLIVGWGFTLNPGMTESDNGTWSTYPKAGAPVMRIDAPGRYEILSESNISLYANSHEFYHNTSASPLLSLWSRPLEITVLPEKYVPSKLPNLTLPTNQTAVVEIENGTSFAKCKAKPCLNPDKLAVKIGTVVTWYNHDIYGHTVTSGKPNDTVTGADFDSGVIRPNKSFNQTFSSPGSFSYFDEVRPWITGEIIVSNTSQYFHLPRQIAPPPPSAVGCYHWTKETG